MVVFPYNQNQCPELNHLASGVGDRPAFTPTEDPFRIHGQHADAAMAGGPPGKRLLMQTKSAIAGKVEIPRHDPCRIFGADMEASTPIQVIGSRRCFVVPAS